MPRPPHSWLNPFATVRRTLIFPSLNGQIRDVLRPIFSVTLPEMNERRRNGR